MKQSKILSKVQKLLVIVEPIQLSFIIYPQEYKILQKISIDGIVYRIDDLDNLFDVTTFQFLKNLND